MSKYEQVVEEVAKKIYSDYIEPNNGVKWESCLPEYRNGCTSTAKEIISNPSIGIIDDDQTPPDNPFYKAESIRRYNRAIIDMQSQGWLKMVEKK